MERLHPDSLTHLQRFNSITLDVNTYWEASQCLLNGGWAALLRQYFYESPTHTDGDAYSPPFYLSKR